MSNACNNLPDHLKQYIVKQDYSLYTAIDQAVWRFVMLISIPFFKKHAHPVYLEGLTKTGIPIDRIPHVKEMDEKLDKFGWGAVAVKGFIPPAAFMELLANRILAIGVDIRTAEHLMYTPSPDIIHESAGHAPIIADPDYANYLCNYGEVARKAIASKQDIEMYEIIREMSDLKENPNADPEEIERVEKEFDEISKSIEWISEASELARMNWWTAEYGLIGTIDDPKIYGAGLLSSVIESNHCLSEKVVKIPYTIDSTKYDYDITEPQPHLFVTENFQKLSMVLEKFSAKMAYKTGGVSGLKKARIAESVTTAVYDSGLQVSGILKEFILNTNNELCYLQYTGPVQLACEDSEIIGHSKDYHVLGFGAPVGNIAGIGKSLSQCSASELKELNVIPNKSITLTYENGVQISGVISDIFCVNNHPLIIKITDCTVTLGDKILFAPEWGDYDLACGGKIVSVFGGPADWVRYYSDLPKNGYAKHQSSNLTDKNRRLNKLYKQVRKIKNSELEPALCRKIMDELEQFYPDEWLILFGLHQLIMDNPELSDISTRNLNKLHQFSNADTPESTIIKRGLKVLMSEEVLTN